MENHFRKDIFSFFQKEKNRSHKDIQDIQAFKDAYYQSRGTKIIRQSSYVLLEIVLWILVFAEIFWLVFLFRMPPFHKFSEMMSQANNSGIFSKTDLDIVEWSVKGLVILLIITTIIITRLVAGLRIQNNKTSKAGIGFMKLIELENERLKEIEELEKKYAYLQGDDIKIELENFTNPLMPPPPKGDTFLDEEQ